jgi:hypothetical protein
MKKRKILIRDSTYISNIPSDTPSRKIRDLITLGRPTHWNTAALPRRVKFPYGLGKTRFESGAEKKKEENKQQKIKKKKKNFLVSLQGN